MRGKEGGREEGRKEGWEKGGREGDSGGNREGKEGESEKERSKEVATLRSLKIIFFVCGRVYVHACVCACVCVRVCVHACVVHATGLNKPLVCVERERGGGRIRKAHLSLVLQVQLVTSNC